MSMAGAEAVLGVCPSRPREGRREDRHQDHRHELQGWDQHWNHGGDHDRERVEGRTP